MALHGPRRAAPSGCLRVPPPAGATPSCPSPPDRCQAPTSGHTRGTQVRKRPRTQPCFPGVPMFLLSYHLDAAHLVVELGEVVDLDNEAAIEREIVRLLPCCGPRAIIVDIRTPLLTPRALGLLLRVRGQAEERGVSMAVVAGYDKAREVRAPRGSTVCCGSPAPSRARSCAAVVLRSRRRRGTRSRAAAAVRRRPPGPRRGRSARTPTPPGLASRESADGRGGCRWPGPDGGSAPWCTPPRSRFPSCCGVFGTELAPARRRRADRAGGERA
ncbi:hypothetical protein SBADM41S_05498 [Streptomyces badius]